MSTSSPGTRSWRSTGLLTGARPFGGVRKATAGLAEALPDIAEAVGGVLTDQNGRFVRYEIRVNQDEYNYLTINDLWRKSGQSGKTIDFPQGPNDNPSRCGAQPCGPVGAMEIKGAWKVLSESEIAGGRFYTTQGTVFNDEQGDPSCTDCPTNQQTASTPYTELDPLGKPLNTGVQVVRTNPIATTDDTAPPLNAYYQGLLAGTVWANYQLISTQWATGGAPKGTPAVIANTTLETFIQPDSSCLGSHISAQTAVQTPADFSFLLGAAQ